GAAFVALQEVEDFLVRCATQARFEPIIVDIRGNCVVGQACCQLPRLVGIVLARGVAQLQEDRVLLAGGLKDGRLQRGLWQRGRRQRGGRRRGCGRGCGRSRGRGGSRSRRCRLRGSGGERQQ